MKKLKSIIYKFSNYIVLFLIVIVWYFVTKFEILPSFILPSPNSVLQAFISDFNIILNNTIYTLLETILGLILSIFFAFIIAILMDRFTFFDKFIYPFLIVSQTIPTIAIAPLIVVWFGFGVLPKVILVFITCFFPLLISILTGFKSIDRDLIKVFQSMNANYFQILTKAKIPLSLSSFFSGLKISTSYAVISAVVAEWLGGDKGLGVYLTRVRKSYNFDKMFAIIFVISIISILLIKLIKFIERRVIFWENQDT